MFACFMLRVATACRNRRGCVPVCRNNIANRHAHIAGFRGGGHDLVLGSIFSRMQMSQDTSYYIDRIVCRRTDGAFCNSAYNGGGNMSLRKPQKCCARHTVPAHGGSLPRMNRAIGQLEGAKKMISDGRCCVEILTQLRAVRTAIRATETEIFKRHLESCVVNSFQNPADAEKKIEETKKMLDFMC